MCDPFSITSLALSASSAIASYQAQAKNAQAQAKYQNQVALQTGQLAQQNYLQQTGEAGNEISQGGLQVSQELSSNSTRGLQVAATANTGAAEGGVGGNSVDELLQDFRHQEAMAADSIKTNQSFTTGQIINQEKSLQAQAQGRIASSRPQPVNGPSSLALGLSLAGSAASSYNNSLQMNQRGPYDPAGNLQNQGVLFRPLPFLGNLLPPPAQRGGTFSS